jgi:signal transduction histidine kinase
MNERPEIDGLELLATLSHELRNPLNAILGWATILSRRGDLPEPVTQGLQAIERNSRLQARMISDVLDYAALSAGQARLAVETIDPYPVVRAAVEGVAAAALEAGVAVEASFDDESLRIEADAARLQQIIDNLLSNAIKFSSRGQVVRLAAQPCGHCLRLVVSDQGQGIDPEFLPRLFERFGRKDTTRPRNHGLGLGLALVKQLTELHSGTVRAESGGKGLGAQFTLEFPLCTAALPVGGSPNER